MMDYKHSKRVKNLLLTMSARQINQLPFKFCSNRHTLIDQIFHNIQLNMMCEVLLFDTSMVHLAKRFQITIATFKSSYASITPANHSSILCVIFNIQMLVYYMIPFMYLKCGIFPLSGVIRPPMSPKQGFS